MTYTLNKLKHNDDASHLISFHLVAGALYSDEHI